MIKGKERMEGNGKERMEGKGEGRGWREKGEGKREDGGRR